MRACLDQDFSSQRGDGEDFSEEGDCLISSNDDWEKHGCGFGIAGEYYFFGDRFGGGKSGAFYNLRHLDNYRWRR